jgi:hypothetical protein
MKEKKMTPPQVFLQGGTGARKKTHRPNKASPSQETGRRQKKKKKKDGMPQYPHCPPAEQRKDRKHVTGTRTVKSKAENEVWVHTTRLYQARNAALGQPFQISYYWLRTRYECAVALVRLSY